VICKPLKMLYARFTRGYARSPPIPPMRLRGHLMVPCGRKKGNMAAADSHRCRAHEITGHAACRDVLMVEVIM
jgi:hypothetical protein